MLTGVSVAKIGGSLLDQPRLADRLRAWRAAQQVRHVVFLVGGGKVVDAVRELYGLQPWGEERAHWLCVGLLGLTTDIVATWLPEWPQTDSLDRLRELTAQDGTTIFRVESFLRNSQDEGLAALPASWNVTTDSIAGQLAIALGADQLLLLKSCLPPPTLAGDLRRLAAAGYIDRHLPELSAHLPCCCAVDFRSTTTGLSAATCILGQPVGNTAPRHEPNHPS